MGVAENIFSQFLSKKSIFKGKDALTINYNPNEILHRDKEISALAKILAPVLRNEKPSNVFIYGKTGTGKTLVTSHVIEELEKVANGKGIPMVSMYINCKMRKISDTEYRLVSQLVRNFGKKVPPTGLPTDEIYRIFFEEAEKSKSNIILILDEIDYLIKRVGDGIIYNLTRINQQLKNTKITIIGISNDVMFTSDLDARVKSSLSEEELVFSPYDAMQLKNILKNRASIAFNDGVVDDSVIAKCAAYAAREHGDARKALDLLRIAGEIAEREGREKILEGDIDKAEDKLETDSVIEIVRKLPKQSQSVLYSIISVINMREPPIFTGDIYEFYKSLCTKIGLKQLTQRRVSDLISELDMLGLITANVISKGRYGRTREISITIPNELVMKIEGIIKGELEI